MKKLRLSLFSLCSVFLLSGCAAAVVTGAAAGGYYAAKSDRSAAEVSNDASITSAINTRYVKDDLISAFDVDVDTRRGVVTLTGTVRSAEAARRAVELARSVTGVKHVDSRLRIVAK